jgi:GxxExxY protein
MELHTSPLGRIVIGCAIEVHTALGPGLLESIYQRCLAREFRLRGIQFQEQVAVPVRYKGENLECGYRVDFVVAEELLVELKAVEHSIPVYQAQMLTYLKLLQLRQGFLINFNVPRLSSGVKSFLL